MKKKTFAVLLPVITILVAFLWIMNADAQYKGTAAQKTSEKAVSV